MTLQMCSINYWALKWVWSTSPASVMYGRTANCPRLKFISPQGISGYQITTSTPGYHLTISFTEDVDLGESSHFKIILFFPTFYSVKFKNVPWLKNILTIQAFECLNFSFSPLEIWSLAGLKHIFLYNFLSQRTFSSFSMIYSSCGPSIF